MAVRNFAWADLASLAEFIYVVRTAQGDERLLTPALLKEELALPGLHPEENCFLFEDGQGLWAYSVVHPEPRMGRVILEIGIHPSHSETGVEQEIVGSALARAKELEARVLHICLHSSEFWSNIMGAAGLSRVRVYWLMRWQEDEVPVMELPNEFEIESFRPGDAARLTRVQNASFEGSWGFCPNTVEEVSYRAGMSISSPEGILFLSHGDETAGYCWTYILGNSRDPIGVIGMIGITPDYRGRGLSRPILLAAMDYLEGKGVRYVGLDVDAANGPAIKLYAAVGFKKVQELHWFEARLS